MFEGAEEPKVQLRRVLASLEQLLAGAVGTVDWQQTLAVKWSHDKSKRA